MSDQPATSLLREQHRLILRVIAAFERALVGAYPALPPVSELHAFISFFRHFTDECHHGGEEDLLFPAMEEHGMGAPVNALREEHRAGRALVRAMADTVGRMDAGDPDAGRELHERGQAYIAFLRAHIEREDEGLFDLADGAIGHAGCAALREGYEDVCGRRFAGLTIEQLQDLGERLIRDHPAR